MGIWNILFFRIVKTFHIFLGKRTINGYCIVSLLQYVGFNMVLESF